MLLDPSIKSDSDRFEMIQALLKKKKAELGPLHERIKKRRDRYHLDHYKGKPKAQPGEERTILSHEQRLVDTGRALLVMEPPEIRAYTEGDEVEDRNRGDRLEAWLRGVLYKQRERLRQDQVDMVAHDMLCGGLGWLFAYWDPNLDNRYNRITQKYDEKMPLESLPIVIKRRDPLHIFPQGGAATGRWDWIMAVEMLPLLSVERLWGIQLKSQRGNKYHERMEDKVEVIDIWSREMDPDTGEESICNAVVVNPVGRPQFAKEVTPMPHYKELPFEAAFCVEVPDTSWERKALPITAAIEQVVADWAAIRNIEIRMLKLYGQLVPYTRGPGEGPELASGFGEAIRLGPEDEFGWPDWPGLPPDFFRFDKLYADEVQGGGMGAPLSQQPPAGASGYSIALRGEAGTLKMVSPAKSLGQALTNTLQQVCSLAAGYAPDHPMTVMGEFTKREGDEQQRRIFSLTGAECEGLFIEVKIAARFPDDKARDRAMGITLATSPVPILDKRTILEKFMHFENAEQIRRRLLEEEAERDPGLRSALIAMALKDAGLLEMVQQFMAGQAQQGPGAAQTGVGMSAPGVGTQIMPQQQLGAVSSQEAGVGPKEQLLPEEEPRGAPFSTV